MVIFSTLMSQCPCKFNSNCRFQVDLSNCFVPGLSGWVVLFVYLCSMICRLGVPMVVTWTLVFQTSQPWSFRYTLMATMVTPGHGSPYVSLVTMKSAIWVAGVFFPKSVEMRMKYTHIYIYTYYIYVYKHIQTKPLRLATHHRSFANFFRMTYFHIHVLCEPLGVFQLHVLRWTSIEASCGLVQSNPQGRDHLDPKQLYHSERVRVTKRYQHGKVCLIIYVFQTLLFRGSWGSGGVEDLWECTFPFEC